MKILDLLLALLFAAGAAVQYNDPDPLIWMLLYGGVALVATLALFGKHILPVTLLVALACAVGLGWSAPGFIEYITGHTNENLMQSMSAERPYIEKTREFLGMLIAFLVALIYVFRARNARSRPHASTPPA